MTRWRSDPMFISAAASYGRRVVGVLLSGFGADGVRGLIQIKLSAGVALVQSPSEACAPTMPRAAISADDVDAALSLDDLASAVVALVAGETVESTPPSRALI
jgi:two-component system, chemotaxis family, protein-glutamate methylesterase/glutaminase